MKDSKITLIVTALVQHGVPVDQALMIAMSSLCVHEGGDFAEACGTYGTTLLEDFWREDNP